tara:strand:+ start:1163 stop:1651 length:489 start_codon:yes stop_codon:yes gene_type:complete
MKQKLNLKNPLIWFSVGFGTGLIPIAPGTFGSILAALIYFIFIDPNLNSFLSISYFAVFIILSFFFGLFIFPISSGNIKDPSFFVWDEFVGMWISCLPLCFFELTFVWLVFAIILFRFFDIWKPWIIRELDLMEGSFGVMIDDVVAGIFTSLILVLTLYLLA